MVFDRYIVKIGHMAFKSSVRAPNAAKMPWEGKKTSAEVPLEASWSLKHHKLAPKLCSHIIVYEQVLANTIKGTTRIAFCLSRETSQKAKSCDSVTDILNKITNY